MTTVRVRTRVAFVAGAMALLFPFAPNLAARGDDHNRPVELPFAKWFTTSPLMEGYWGGNLDNKFVGELLRRQASANPDLNPVALLEAVYEFHHGDDFFTALIQGGSDNVTGAGNLEGVILAGWRAGASVKVQYDRIAAGCAGAPAGKPCFVGTIQVGRAPRD